MNHKDVLNSPECEEWLDGTEEEKRSILKRKVLELVKRKKDTQLLRCKYVYRKKKQRNGRSRYKVRLVILGCNQEKDEEQQTFAPVVKGITIRILFALACCSICLFISWTLLLHSAMLISLTLRKYTWESYLMRRCPMVTAFVCERHSMYYAHLRETGTSISISISNHSILNHVC
jgi:hypothetical protein